MAFAFMKLDELRLQMRLIYSKFREYYNCPILKSIKWYIVILKRYVDVVYMVERIYKTYTIYNEMKFEFSKKDREIKDKAKMERKKNKKPPTGGEEGQPPSETPTAPADEIPAAPPGETPGAPADETPAAPADETPAAPADETPAAPADETPASL